MVYKVAVLCDGVQLSDIMGIDLFGNLSLLVLNWANATVPVPPHILSQGLDIEFLYVSGNPDVASTTPNVKIIPTHTYDSCPRDIDVLFVGGPLFSHRPEGSMRLFRDLFAEGPEGGKGKDGLVLLTTCTGSMWVADAGVLEGKKCTTNRMMLHSARERNPGVQWEDRRWVVDKLGRGEVWTSGAAGCGIDMIAAFVEEKMPKPLALLGRLGLDVDPWVLGQDYKEPLEKAMAVMAPPN